MRLKLLIGIILPIAILVICCKKDSNPNSNWIPGDPWVDTRDGQSYNTVQIGTQVWMSENLKTTIDIFGNPFQLVVEDIDWWILDDSEKACCFYENDNNSIYGVLYTWNAALEACPTGWHLPTSDEWTILDSYIANNIESGTVCDALKSTYGWSFNGEDKSGSDKFGFTALPGGYRFSGNGQFDDAGSRAFWWTSHGYHPDRAYFIEISANAEAIDLEEYYRHNGFSVRCIKDK